MKVVAKDGKVRAEAGADKRNADYKPGKALFGNFHPALSATIAKAYAPGAADSQKIDLLIIDGGFIVPIDVIKRPAKTAQARLIVAARRTVCSAEPCGDSFTSSPTILSSRGRARA